MIATALGVALALAGCANKRPDPQVELMAKMLEAAEIGDAQRSADAGVGTATPSVRAAPGGR